ncbi:aspartyl protease family protein [Bordetella genomosp. 11]|uniref:Peptidase A2 domain-containing protein n=1 Tax=Bordetella genomosp. 11 TaxID=1416808 RepID=A0A261UCW7_9BORD|nr:aspartyl protease family protein [Bordetella genomosp. 11]OZI59451.1 hypothetical protein CAL28_07845 [Bordetella genomosp. 11]
MKISTIIISFLTMAGLTSTLPLNASAGSCSTGLTTHVAQFESAIQYDDEQSKSNPTVHVMVNGKLAKMMLDTGANKNLLWDPSLLDETPGPQSQSVDSHVASADSRSVEAVLGDGRGHAQRQQFYLLANSVLAADGYSGILSPQAIAGQNAVVIDFERNCFFTSAPFDIDSVKEVQIRRGKTIQNPYDVMAIHVELDGRNIPLLVDSGAPRTTIIASLIATKPKGPESPRMMDVFGAELPKAEQMRLVDLKVNGQALTAHPVIPAPATSNKGIENSGYIGMDILKERVLYYDGVRQEFDLLTRQPIVKYTIVKPETHTD